MIKLSSYLISFFIFTSAVNAMDVVDKRAIEIQGHRGCRGNLPENTLAAFERALEGGIDVLELDLAVTRDRVLVISHDPRITRALCQNSDGSEIGSEWLINDLTLEEVQSFDCGSKKHPRFPEQEMRPGQHIPTLDELFALVRASSSPHAQTIRFNIETKIFADHPECTVTAEIFAELVSQAFSLSGFADRITLQSFVPSTLIEAKKRLPELKTIALVEDASIDMISLGEIIAAYAISPDYRLLTKEKVNELHAKGFKVIPWTINEQDAWSMAVDMGVDGIITDYPFALRNFLTSW